MEKKEESEGKAKWKTMTENTTVHWMFRRNRTYQDLKQMTQSPANGEADALNLSSGREPKQEKKK